MEFVFLRNGRYVVHVGLWLRPLLGYFGENRSNPAEAILMNTRIG